ncbi:MAG: Rieske 2Fe-2S domain-containing protein [Firmicutes bacterium]|nr:Rieske 2Fe-2S domain-containing protein [Bacillota bacterium]
MNYFVTEWKHLLEKKKIRIKIEARSIIVFVVDELPYALLDKCPHQGFPLFNGRFESGIIQCKEHGLEIDVRTGVVINLVKANYLDLSESDRVVKTFPAFVERDKVYVVL